MFHLDPPPEFQSFDPYGEVEIYYRNLPHWRQRNATYFVTFRLSDSLPQSKLNELRQIREEWLLNSFNGREPGTDVNSIRQNQKSWEELSREIMTRTEAWLDRGYGSCVLREVKYRKIVRDAWFEFDRKDYRLGDFVLMPNHVHLLIQPIVSKLEIILKGRKQWTSRQINRELSRKGPLWQQESYDRIIRDPQHLWRAVQYIGNNPKKANLDDSSATKWIDPEWEALGWRFTEEAG